MVPGSRIVRSSLFRRAAALVVGGSALSAAWAASLAAPGTPGAAPAAWDAGLVEPLRSAPRALRAAGWALRSAAEYKALKATHGRVNYNSKPPSEPDSPQDPDSYKSQLSQLHARRGEALVKVLQVNGGVYIKAGQLASTVAAVPPEYRRHLESLQDAVPPRPIHEVEAVLEQELGGSASDIFDTFEPCARAAASLAQVHKATLKGGVPVAVKVQYPGLEAAVLQDMAAMRILASAASSMFPDVRIEWVLEPLERGLKQEMDFRSEAANSERMKAFLDSGPLKGLCTTPFIVPQLCTRRVLTMEWIDGCKITDTEALEAAGFVPREVGRVLVGAFADMMFRGGLVHGDPHPGNLLVRSGEEQPTARHGWAIPSWLWSWGWPVKPPKPQIVVLDHGLYIELDEDLVTSYASLWCLMAAGDIRGAAKEGAGLVGDRAGPFLPVLLMPPGSHTKEERRQLRKDGGIHSVADATQMVEDEVPRQLLDAIKVGAIVRNVALRLGVTPRERLRINASHAIRRSPRRTTRWRASAVLWGEAVVSACLGLWRAATERATRLLFFGLPAAA